MVSLPSPGFHSNVSLPAPTIMHVVAPEADEVVVAVAAEERVVPAAADERVVASPTILRELHDAGHHGGRVHGVVAAQGVDGEAVIGPFRVGHEYEGGQAGHSEAARAVA